jgi:hypothetical protein
MSNLLRSSVLLMLLGFVSACTITPDKEGAANGFQILGIAQGKMKKIDDEWVVYEETDDMIYEVNDHCTYAERKIECLRHGFIIQYDSKDQDVELACTVRTNMKVDAGNSAEEKYVDTQQDDFYIPLKGSEKKFINVQYVSGQSGLSDLAMETVCSLYGRTVFKFNQRVRFQQ